MTAIKVSVSDDRLLGQALRFRQGRRVYVGRDVYQMDGTDGRGDTMILPSKVYQQVRKGDVDRNDVQYSYITGTYRFNAGL